MATNKKITELPNATLPITTGTKFEAVQGGLNVQVDADDMPGAGTVTSVNGDTGPAVILTASDVSADPAGSSATVASNLAAHISDATDAHAGTAITNTPAGNISATTVQAAINELDSEKASIVGVFTASGTNTYTVTVPGISALASGQSFDVKFTNANTGSSTLNVNSLGAVTLRKSVTVALVTGDIIAGGVYRVAYDGTNFQLMHNFNIGLGASGNFVYSNNLPLQVPSITLSASAGTADVTSPVLSGSGSAALLTTRYSNAADLVGFKLTNNGSSTYGAHTYKIFEASTDNQPFNLSTGTATFIGVEINPTYNMTGGTTTLIDLYINAAETALTGATHYGILAPSTTALNGFGTATPVSTLETSQSFGAGIITTTTDLTLSAAHHTVLVDATSGNITITLPAVATRARRIYCIKKIDSSGNTVTIDGNASETIDGATTVVLSTQYSGKQIQGNGSAWFIISSF